MYQLRLIFISLFVSLTLFSTPSIWANNKDELSWETYSAEKVTSAKGSKNVIIYFWAEWCALAINLENLLLPIKKFKKSIKDFLLLKVDCTEESTSLEKLQEKYGVESLPVIVFIDKSGKYINSSKLTGFEPPLEFIKELKLF